MMQYIANNPFWLMLIMVFVAVMLLLEGSFLLWKSYQGPGALKVRKRMRALSAVRDENKQPALFKQRLLSEVPAIERFLLNLSRAQRLEKFILQSGLDWSVSLVLLVCLVLGASGFLMMVVIVHQPVLLSAGSGIVLAALPIFYVDKRRKMRLRKLEVQLPEALDLITRSLRSGHALSSALQMVGDEMPEPIAGEFRSVHEEVNFGVSLENALMGLAERVPLTDVRYFIVSVLIQRDSGGNLTEVLGNLSRLIRERLKLLSKVRVLSSEGRLSAWVLGVMPFALAGVMYLANPEFMAPLWNDPIGISIIQYTLILMVFGIAVLRKIVKIRV